MAGVVPHEMAPPSDMTSLTAQIDLMVRERQFAEAGDRIIIVAGASLGTPGTLNSVILHTVGDGWLGEAVPVC